MGTSVVTGWPNFVRKEIVPHGPRWRWNIAFRGRGHTFVTMREGKANGGPFDPLPAENDQLTTIDDTITVSIIFLSRSWTSEKMIFCCSTKKHVTPGGEGVYRSVGRFIFSRYPREREECSDGPRRHELWKKVCLKRNPCGIKIVYYFSNRVDLEADARRVRDPVCRRLREAVLRRRCQTSPPLFGLLR